MPKPLGEKYLDKPATLGEKIRNRRMEKGMLQKDVAHIIGVTEESIYNWENNRSEPAICYYPNIVKFLGYFPFEIDTNTLAGKIKMYRYIKGVSQETLAKELQLNESTIYYYENGKHKPLRKVLRKLIVLLSAAGIKVYDEH